MIVPTRESRVPKGLLAFVAVLAIFSAGCRTFSLAADRCPPLASTPLALQPSAPSKPGKVKIQYLGVGGYLVRRGDDVVLFGPQYTNPKLGDLLSNSVIGTNQTLVDQLLPSDAVMARAIVVGHSHYDHLLDTPYIARHKARQAKVYGSPTMVNLVGTTIGVDRVVDVAKAPTDQGWIAITERMRLMPITSKHSNQLRLPIIDLPLHLWRGIVTEPSATLPTTAEGWVEGEVYTYLLDFLDEHGDVDFRIYYQDSGTSAPIGFPGAATGSSPDSVRTLPGNAPIDVLLLAIGGDPKSQTGHPEALIAATEPRYVLLGHWEYFFAPQTTFGRKIKAPPGQDVKEIVGRAHEAMKASHVPGQPFLPCPTKSTFFFPVVSDAK